MVRLIIFLIRIRLGLKKHQFFRFTNQKSGACYYFTKTNVIKVERGYSEPSGVSLNWLLDKNCKITKISGIHPWG